MALCTMAGAAAIRKGLQTRKGMVSALPWFQDLDLVEPEAMVFGGHDVRPIPLAEAALNYHRQTGVLDPELLRRIKPFLGGIEERIRPGFTLNAPKHLKRLARGVHVGKRISPAQLVEKTQRDLRAFRRKSRLKRLVMVYLASTEGAAAETIQGLDLKGFERRLGRKRADGLTSSLVYAYAALKMGIPFINFTPSPGVEVPALNELAALESVPYAGNDGKTGETLVKTALAPMFMARNMRILTWFGYNLLGNGDGETLTDPVRRQSKLKSKDNALASMVKDPDLTSKVTIDYAPSLHDWKTAWDYIHFEGFLGTRMAMQFTWQGCDSALAAPLVLDLVRFSDLSARRGEAGPLTHLASFFKNPLGVEEQNFHRQFQLLLDYAENASGTPH